MQGKHCPLPFSFQGFLPSFGITIITGVCLTPSKYYTASVSLKESKIILGSTYLHDDRQNHGDVGTWSHLIVHWAHHHGLCSFPQSGTRGLGGHQISLELCCRNPSRQIQWKLLYALTWKCKLHCKCKHTSMTHNTHPIARAFLLSIVLGSNLGLPWCDIWYIMYKNLFP